MSDLLKEAIADAKTVRETAIANAKMALEEAFTPHLKSMLSAKLAEEDDEEDAEEMYGKEEGEHEEGMHGDEEEGMHGDEEEGMHDNDEGREDKEEGEHEDEEEGMRNEDIIEIDGVKYAPIVSEEDDEDEDAEEMREDEELDLESVIKELETEIAEAEKSDDDLTEGEHEDDDEKKDEVKEDVVTEEDEEDEDKDKTDEQSTSSGIGKGTGVKMASSSDEEDPGKGKIKESVDKLKAELKEHKEAVAFLREKLHEVNILNAKLLYTNRLFKEFVLSNDQKMKIVETFDRAQTTREIKLVYSTLAESFKGGSVKKNRVQESASQKSGTTKPSKKIITEESQVADRFKKLAGII